MSEMKDFKQFCRKNEMVKEEEDDDNGIFGIYEQLAQLELSKGYVELSPKKDKAVQPPLEPPQVVRLSSGIQQATPLPPPPPPPPLVVVLDDDDDDECQEIALGPPPPQMMVLDREMQDVALGPPQVVVLDEEVEEMAPPARMESVFAQAVNPKARGIRDRQRKYPPPESSSAGRRGRGRGRPPSKEEKPSWLPVMWKVNSKIRKNGASAGHKDKYFLSPEDRKYRSRKEVMKHLTTLSTM